MHGQPSPLLPRWQCSGCWVQQTDGDIYNLSNVAILHNNAGHWSWALAAGNTIPGGAEWKLIGQSRAGSRPRVWRHSYAHISNIYYTFCIYISTYGRYYLRQCTGYPTSVKMSPWTPERIRRRWIRNVRSLHPPITRADQTAPKCKHCHTDNVFPIFPRGGSNKFTDFIFILILF